MDNLYQYIVDKDIVNYYELAEHLKNDFAIKSKIYEDEGLIVLNYCQIDSPKTHPIVMECRGVILDNLLNVVCKPLNRFFNFGEALEITSRFNIRNSIAYEKVDGSLIKVYYWEGSWRIATRGTAFAETTNYTGQVFLDMVLKTVGCNTLEEFNTRMNRSMTDKFCTYLFEFISPENRIVTRYSGAELVLLAIVDHMGDYEEIINPSRLSIVANYLSMTLANIRVAKTYDTSDIDDLKPLLAHLRGLEEGFVCYDPSSGIRVKIKSEEYVRVHKIRGESIPTPNRIMSLVVENEQDEYLAYFPEDADMFVPYIDDYKRFITEIDIEYQKAKGIENQKEFALSIKDLSYKPILFFARKDGNLPSDQFNKLDNRNKIKYLSHYMVAHLEERG